MPETQRAQGSLVSPSRVWPPSGTARVALCSYAAAMCAALAGYPLDTIKTRLQTYKYPSFWKCITSTYKQGGISAFYSGIAASLISSSLARAFTMSLYTSLLPQYARLLGASDPRGPAVTFLSGLTAGATCTLFTCPFEFTKVASQVETLVYRARGLPKPENIGALRAFKDICKRGGLLQLYGGFRYQLYRDSLGSAIYFSVYEYAKSELGKFFESSPGTPHPLSIIVSGGLCGVVAWTAVYPLDTLKSEYQRDLYSHSLANSLEFRDTVVTPPKLRISLSMYRGLGFSILRTSLNGVVLFSCFEYFMYLTRPVKGAQH